MRFHLNKQQYADICNRMAALGFSSKTSRIACQDHYQNQPTDIDITRERVYTKQAGSRFSPWGIKQQLLLL
jgi:hypothetical protein